MTEPLKKLVVKIGESVKYFDLTEEEILQRQQQEAEFLADMEARRQEKETQDALIASGRAKLKLGQPLTEEEANLLLPEQSPRI